MGAGRADGARARDRSRAELGANADLPSGEVSIAGNTRANGVMVDHNGPKKVVYPMVADALAWWGLARQVPADVRVAARVSAWGGSHPGEVGI